MWPFTLQPSFQLSTFALLLSIALVIIHFLLRVFNRTYDSKVIAQVIGVCAILSLSFASNNPFIYAISVIIIATLVTELEFLEKLMALLWDRHDYWEFRRQENTPGQLRNDNQDKQVLEEFSKKLKTAEQREKQLSSLLEQKEKSQIDLKMLYHFEKTYRIIFNSQLNFLIMLEKQELSAPLAVAYYNRAVLRSQQTTFTFENFVSFLENSYLALYEKGTNTFKITPLGKVFLDYLRQNQIPLQKFV